MGKASITNIYEVQWVELSRWSYVRVGLRLGLGLGLGLGSGLGIVLYGKDT